MKTEPMRQAGVLNIVSGALVASYGVFYLILVVLLANSRYATINRGQKELAS
jgi:hypothetical protein